MEVGYELAYRLRLTSLLQKNKEKICKQSDCFVNSSVLSGITGCPTEARAKKKNCNKAIVSETRALSQELPGDQPKHARRKKPTTKRLFQKLECCLRNYRVRARRKKTATKRLFQKLERCLRNYRVPSRSAAHEEKKTDRKSVV